MFYSVNSSNVNSQSSIKNILLKMGQEITEKKRLGSYKLKAVWTKECDDYFKLWAEGLKHENRKKKIKML